MVVRHTSWGATGAVPGVIKGRERSAPADTLSLTASMIRTAAPPITTSHTNARSESVVRQRAFETHGTLVPILLHPTKRSADMHLRDPAVFLRVTLAVVVVVTSSCATPTALAPGADRVKFTQDAADVARCKPVGNVSAVRERGNSESYLRNTTIGLGGNTVFRTASFEGVVYNCPQ